MRKLLTNLLGITLLLCIVLSVKTSNAKGDQPVSETKIAFTENVGQVKDQNANLRPDIDYSINAGGINIFVGDGQIHYQWCKTLNTTKDLDNETDPIKIAEEQQKQINAPIATQRLDVVLVGANKNAQVLAEEQQAYFENHFLPNQTDAAVAHTFTKITYKNVYPNIDWVLYTKNNQLKYDFVVHPGGNIQDIKIQYNGADKIEMNEGAVTITTAMGSITEQAPYSYDALTKETVASSFELEGNMLRFGVADHNGTLVIDPWLEWATYYGSTDQDWSNTSATDLQGNVYLGGVTRSSSNIATSGAYQDTLTPQPYNSTWTHNGFVAKFTVAGVRLWATYLPGHVGDIACSNDGYVYIAGSIDSIVGLATTGAHQTTFGGHGIYYTGYYNQGDAYLTKFSSTGQRVWFTYYGGSENDRGTSVKIDGNGFIYLGGTTESNNNMASVGAHRTTISPPTWTWNAYYGHSGFIAKFNPAGTRQWATYYPGMISDLAIDNNNNIYGTGNTWHDTGVATIGSHQSFHTGTINPSTQAQWEAFLVKFNSNGVRQWGTYYGGYDYDWGVAVDCDPSNNVYLFGNTFSTNFIATTNAHKSSHTGNTYDAFLVKFSSAGVRSWGTYFGGTSAEYGGSLLVTPSYRIYMSGSTISPTGIATPGAYQTSLASSTYDDYLVEFDTAGVQKYGTYYGGPSQEYSWGYGGYGWGNGGGGLSYNYTGRVHLGSATGSSSGIATAGAHQTTYASSINVYDAYLATFITDTIAYFVHPFNQTVFCAGDTVKIPYLTSYSFKPGNTFTMQLSNATGGFASPVNIGARVDTTGDTIICVIPTNTPTGTGYRMRIASSSPSRISVDNYVNITISNPGSVTATNNSPICVGDTMKLFAGAQATTGVTYSWIGVNTFTSTQKNPTKPNATLTDAGDYVVTASVGGCSVKDTTTVVINPIPAKPSASSNSTVCPNTALNLYATTTTPNATYSWIGPNSYSSTVQNPTVSSNATYGMAGDYIVKVTALGCVSEADTATVVIGITTPTPNANSNSPICAGKPLILTASSISNATYQWTGPNSFTSTQQNPTLFTTSSTTAGTYYVKATVNGCESLFDSVVVVINPTASIAIFPSPGDSICTGETATFIAITNNAGSSPVYTWVKNGTPISGSNASSYSSSSINDGDIIFCELSNVTTCVGSVDSSNQVAMNVRPYMAPTVSITANPLTPLEPMQLVTFTATSTYAGNNPVYQWMRNGNPVVGATNNIWGTYQLSDGDTIHTVLTSSDRCAQPKEAVSNKITVQVLLSVDDLNLLSNIGLYPNPNKGSFTLTGQMKTNDAININIINTIGQTVYRGTAQPINYTLNHRIDLNTELASGTYILNMQTENATKTLRFTIQK